MFLTQLIIYVLYKARVAIKTTGNYVCVLHGIYCVFAIRYCELKVTTVKLLGVQVPTEARAILYGESVVYN